MPGGPALASLSRGCAVDSAPSASCGPPSCSRALGSGVGGRAQPSALTHGTRRRRGVLCVRADKAQPPSRGPAGPGAGAALAPKRAPAPGPAASPLAVPGGASTDSSAATVSVPLVEPGTIEPPQPDASGAWDLDQRKSDFYILRTDGMSCTRETVQAPGWIQFRHPSSQQYMLVWKRKPQRALLLKKPGDELRTQFKEVAEYLRDEGIEVLVQAPEAAALAGDAQYDFLRDAGPLQASGRLHEYVDFVVCLGGDGVVLHASSLFTGGSPPVVSFNLGSLGFLTHHSYGTFRDALCSLIYGDVAAGECSVDEGEGALEGVYITLRLRLRCQLFRRGRPEAPEQAFEVMNEMVINRGASPFLSKIEVWEGGRLVTKVQADGILVATPTGSTAYSVSAGGSMVHPGVSGILLTPICPHTLSFRPIVLPDYALLELRVPDDARSCAYVCFDGQHRQELCHGDWLRVGMSQNPLPTVNLKDQTSDWFVSLQRCFGWNQRLEQKPFDSADVLGSVDSFDSL